MDVRRGESNLQMFGMQLDFTLDSAKRREDSHTAKKTVRTRKVRR
jgi:hypothetical protein